jgi:hypothetical protein
MDNPGEIKIRALPRSNEGQAKQKQTPNQNQSEKPKMPAQKRWIIYVGVCALALGVFTFFYPNQKAIKTASAKKAKTKVQGQIDLASVTTRINENVSRHMQDAEIKTEMMKRNSEMDNASFKNSIRDVKESEDDASLPEDRHSYGVQLDNDENVDRMLEDINPESPHYNESTPADKINARIADRKWMNEMERAEKIQFISNFIRSAYDRGYEVEIDANLVVVGVKKINHNKVLDINQVIDRLAKSH